MPKTDMSSQWVYAYRFTRFKGGDSALMTRQNLPQWKKLLANSREKFLESLFFA